MNIEYMAAYAVFAALLVWIVRLVRQIIRPAPPRAPEPDLPDNALVVDGSNVMHWGGDPSVLVLNRVLRALEAQGKWPVVYFDANVGYKLMDRHVDPPELARLIGVSRHQVVVVPSGVPADPVLIERALRNGVRIVSDDRFRDWHDAYPRVRDTGYVIRGKWQEGSVIFGTNGRKRKAR